jgi:hypothetical protein
LQQIWSTASARPAASLAQVLGGKKRVYFTRVFMLFRRSFFFSFLITLFKHISSYNCGFKGILFVFFLLFWVTNLFVYSKREKKKTNPSCRADWQQLLDARPVNQDPWAVETWLKSETWAYPQKKIHTSQGFFWKTRNHSHIKHSQSDTWQIRVEQQDEFGTS